MGLISKWNWEPREQNIDHFDRAVLSPTKVDSTWMLRYDSRTVFKWERFNMAGLAFDSRWYGVKILSSPSGSSKFNSKKEKKTKKKRIMSGRYLDTRLRETIQGRFMIKLVPTLTFATSLSENWTHAANSGQNKGRWTAIQDWISRKDPHWPKDNYLLNPMQSRSICCMNIHETHIWNL